MTEEWRPVLGGIYEVSRDGYVRRAVGGKGARTGRLLTRFVATTGYYVVNVCINGECRVVHVHSLMAEAFIGPRPQGYMVNHKDGIKTNLDLGNLEYVTRAENAAHAGRLGLVQSGANHWSNRRAAP
jgi:hypothetical protein